jgi:hypothetical protein
MSIVELPTWRLVGDVSDRQALRTGVATSRPKVKVVRSNQIAFCDTCASPIDFGAVIRGSRNYCSVECSLGGSVS